MIRFRMIATVCQLVFLTQSCPAELLFTTEVMPTAGLPGFNTYRISATSDLGNIVAFDFTRVGSFGVSGPIHQVAIAEQATLFADLIPTFESTDPSQDSHFLVDHDEGLSLFLEESDNYLHGAFAFIGGRQLTIGNSLPFLQIVTADPSAVSLTGALAIRRPNNDVLDQPFNLSLADIPVGPAPQLPVLPIPDPVPVPVPVATPIEVSEPKTEPTKPDIVVTDLVIAPPVEPEDPPALPDRTTLPHEVRLEPIEDQEKVKFLEPSILPGFTPAIEGWAFALTGGQPIQFDLTSLEASNDAILGTPFVSEFRRVGIQQPIAAWSCDTGTAFAHLNRAPLLPAVPEPAASVLLPLAVCCFAAVRRRKRDSTS